jgi:hypothetical protein
MLALCSLFGVAAALKTVKLSEGFAIESDKNCNLRILFNQRVLFESDDQLLNVGYGYLDRGEIMANGNLNEIPEPHIYRNAKMEC